MFDFDLFLIENGPGTDNEKLFVKIVNSFIKKNEYKPITIVFKDANRTVSYDKIISVIDVSLDNKDRRKADVYLVHESGKDEYRIPVSLKTHNADYWESAQSYWGTKAREWIDKLVTKGKIKLTKKRDGYYEIEPQIAVRASAAESKDVMFGSDILPNGCIIKNSFKSEDFSMNGNKLEVNVTMVITDVKDVKDTGEEVWFFCRRDPGRNCVDLGYNGIRILAACQRRIATDSILKIEE